MVICNPGVRYIDIILGAAPMLRTETHQTPVTAPTWCAFCRANRPDALFPYRFATRHSPC